MAPSTTFDWALFYCQRGWFPIPVPMGSKAPVLPEWEKLRITVETAPAYFANGLGNKNIGLSLTGDLRDGDLDCPEAVALASAFLPVTPLRSGRHSNPLSHWWYTSTSHHREFIDLDGTMLLELRANNHQTLVQPSLHDETGELCTWEHYEAIPAEVESKTLERACGKLAAATLLSRHYPAVGARHGFALALSGFLLRNGFTSEQVVDFLLSVAQVAGDEELSDREKCVATTHEQFSQGFPATGGPALRVIIGDKVFDKITAWLGIAKTQNARGKVELPIIDLPPVAPEMLPSWPPEAIGGDFITDLVHQLTDGTRIPPAFVREEIVLVLGQLTDGRVGYPMHRELRVHRYLLLLTERPQSCKGESWSRVAGKPGHFRLALTAGDNKVADAGECGSGQYLARLLQENPRYVAFWDEGSELFAKASSENSILFSGLKKLYEGTCHHTGSFTNKRFGTDEGYLSVLIHATRKRFEQAFTGKGAIEDGLFSRFTLAYAGQLPSVAGDWPERDFHQEKALAQKILELVPNQSDGQIYTPTIEPDAREYMWELQKELQRHDHPQVDYMPRLLEQIKIDVLMRCIFSGSRSITLEHVERAIAWGEHQFRLRVSLWPPDSGNKLETLTQSILAFAEKHVLGFTEAHLMKHCNVSRDGTHETLARAMKSLLNRELMPIGKNRRGNVVYRLVQEDDGVEIKPRPIKYPPKDEASK